MKRVAIMQPYFLPYIGYFQLINKVDLFVIYDDVQFTKKGWINRNSVPANNGIWKFTIACEAAGETSKIGEKKISKEFDRDKFISRIRKEYRKALDENMQALELIERIIRFSDNNLFNFVSNSIQELAHYLEIPSSRILVSSEIGDFTSLKSQDKVLALCRELGATHYLNPISGMHIYSKELFTKEGLNLEFFQPDLGTQDKLDTDLGFSVIHTLISQPRERVIQLAKLGNILNP